MKWRLSSQRLCSTLMLSMVSALAAIAGPSSAQGLPDPHRPVRVLVGFAPGGAVDVMARLVVPTLSRMLGAPVVVENKPGANGVIAALTVIHAKPDGHTLLFTFAGTFAQYPYTVANLPYDPFKDFTPISLVATGPNVLEEHVDVPAHNVHELIAYAKAHPGTLRIASPGYGSSPYIYAAKFIRDTGVDILQVPYKGAGDAIPDVLAGRVQLEFDAAPSAVQSVATGRLRMLGITATQRSPLLPDVPTLDEQGISGLDIPGWNALFGPPNLPPAVLAALNAAVAKTIADPQVRTLINRSVWEPKSSSSEALAALVKSDNQRWGKMIKEVGVEPR